MVLYGPHVTMVYLLPYKLFKDLTYVGYLNAFLFLNSLRSDDLASDIWDDLINCVTSSLG